MTRARVLADLGNSGTFSTNADTNRVGISSANPTATLDVTGDVNVSSAATFGGNVTVGGVLTYEDVTNVDSVGVLTARLGANISGGDGLKVTANGAQITGVSTFSSAIDANGDLDVDGQTDLDNLVVAGVSTFSSLIDLNAELDVDGQTDLDNLQVAGVSTFSAAIDLNAELDVDGQTDLDTLQVAGVSTFASNVSVVGSVHAGVLRVVGNGTTYPRIVGTPDGTFYSESSSTVYPWQLNPNGRATFVSRCDFGSSSVADVSGKFSNGDAASATLYVTNHNNSGDLFSGRNSSNAEVINFGVDGSASLAAGAFAIASDGDISTNIRGHGSIELDSTGGFSSPKVKLFSNTGNGTFAGDILSTKSAGTIKAESSSDSKFAALYAGDNSNDSAILWQNGDLRFYNTTTRVTINRGGQVLVGHGSTSTHAGTAPLQVTTATSGAFTGQFRARSTNDYSFLAFTSHDGTEDLAQIGVQRTAASKGQFLFYTNSGNANGVERMRLEDLGALRTYMTGTAARFHLASDQAAGTTILLNVVHSRSAIATGGSASCRIYTNGDIENTNNRYDVLSDENLKENIVDANSQWDDIKSLRIRKFNFKEETGNPTHTQIGVVAQEVERVSPGLVTVRPALTEEGESSGDTVKTVSSSVIYMKAVKALQEAMERIETLEQRLTDAGL